MPKPPGSERTPAALGELERLEISPRLGTTGCAVFTPQLHARRESSDRNTLIFFDLFQSGRGAPPQGFPAAPASSSLTGQHGPVRKLSFGELLTTAAAIFALADSQTFRKRLWEPLFDRWATWQATTVTWRIDRWSWLDWSALAGLAVIAIASWALVRRAWHEHRLHPSDNFNLWALGIGFLGLCGFVIGFWRWQPEWVLETLPMARRAWWW